MTTVSYLDTIITLIGMPTLAQADTQAVHLRAPPAPQQLQQTVESSHTGHCVPALFLFLFTMKRPCTQRIVLHCSYSVYTGTRTLTDSLKDAALHQYLDIGWMKDTVQENADDDIVTKLYFFRAQTK
jgi:hypothetical protein